MSGILIHGGMFLLVDVTNVWDSVLSCCWDECCEDVRYSDDIVLEHVPECDSPIDSCPEDEPLSVQGRLQKCSGFWKEEFEVSQFVLDIVTNGYQLPFIAFPQPMTAKNHRSALEHSKKPSVIWSGHTVYGNHCLIRKCVVPFKWLKMQRASLGWSLTFVMSTSFLTSTSLSMRVSISFLPYLRRAILLFHLI